MRVRDKQSVDAKPRTDATNEDKLQVCNRRPGRLSVAPLMTRAGGHNDARAARERPPRAQPGNIDSLYHNRAHDIKPCPHTPFGMSCG